MFHSYSICNARTKHMLLHTNSYKHTHALGMQQYGSISYCVLLCNILYDIAILQYLTTCHHFIATFIYAYNIGRDSVASHLI